MIEEEARSGGGGREKRVAIGNGAVKVRCIRERVRVYSTCLYAISRNYG